MIDDHLKQVHFYIIMNIEWVNHASFIVNTNGLSIMSDPYLKGTSFNNGWALLSDSIFSSDDFKRVTHIWISHEHPDHFNPETIKMIPSSWYKNGTVLFQKTNDNKVITYLKKMKFNVIEVENNKWMSIGNGVEIMVGSFPFLDSWMAIRSEGNIILNLNDIWFNNIEYFENIKSILGSKIDILFASFSFGSWIGNPDSPENSEHPRIFLNQFIKFSEIFNPKWVVPSASYIYFCHEENYFMNKYKIKLDIVYNTIKQAGDWIPMVFYPGDKWNLGEPWDSSYAILKYNNDIQAVNNREKLYIKSKSVPLKKIKKLIPNFYKLVYSYYPVHFLKEVKPIGFWLTDLKKGVIIDFTLGTYFTNHIDKTLTISCHSESLHFLLKETWGPTTLHINGRYTVLDGKNNDAFVHLDIMMSRINSAIRLFDTKDTYRSNGVVFKSRLSNFTYKIQKYFSPTV